MGNDFSQNFRPLTHYNGPDINVLSAIVGISDETLEDRYPKRANFYTHYLQSREDKQNVYQKLMELVGLQQPRITSINKTEAELREAVKEYYKVESESELLKHAQQVIDTSAWKGAVKIENPTRGGGFDKRPVDMYNYLFPNKKEEKTEDKTEEGIVKTFNEYTDKQDVVDRLYKHPIYSPDNDKVEIVDRAIFVALTYIVRAISLFITEWAIFSGYITSFIGAFNMYFGMYICIFLLLVFITNSREDDILFKILLFYINSSAENGKGIIRIIVHILCVLMILPIPYIVKEYNTGNKKSTNLSFSEKAYILRAVDRFTLYIWLVTSIVGFNL